MAQVTQNKPRGFGSGFVAGFGLAVILGLSGFSWALYTGRLARGEVAFSVEDAADYLPQSVKLPPVRKAEKRDFIGGQLGGMP